MFNIRYQAALSCVTIAAEQGYVDLDADEIDFIQTQRLWLATDRSRARRILETFVYGALDLQGLPRFPVPAEYLAACIALNVHPSNYMAACVVIGGAEWTENVAQQRDEPVSPDRS